MDKMYFYNYLKDYFFEVGDRIIGFDKTILEDSNKLHEFLDSRAQLAFEEFKRYESGFSGHELAMETLFAGLKDLEPTEEEREEEEKYRKGRDEEERMLREEDYYD